MTEFALLFLYLQYLLHQNDRINARAAAKHVEQKFISYIMLATLTIYILASTLRGGRFDGLPEILSLSVTFYTQELIRFKGRSIQKITIVSLKTT